MCFWETNCHNLIVSKAIIIVKSTAFTEQNPLLFWSSMLVYGVQLHSTDCMFLSLHSTSTTRWNITKACNWLKQKAGPNDMGTIYSLVAAKYQQTIRQMSLKACYMSIPWHKLRTKSTKSHMSLHFFSHGHGTRNHWLSKSANAMC